jgi:hypothetical protein
LLDEAAIMRQAMLTTATSRDEGVAASYLKLVAQRLEISPERRQLLQHVPQPGRLLEILDQCRREVALEQRVHEGKTWANAAPCSDPTGGADDEVGGQDPAAIQFWSSAGYHWQVDWPYRFVVIGSIVLWLQGVPFGTIAIGALVLIGGAVGYRAWDRERQRADAYKRRADELAGLSGKDQEEI